MQYILFEKGIHAILSSIKRAENFQNFLEQNVFKDGLNGYVGYDDDLCEILIKYIVELFNIEDKEILEDDLWWRLYECNDQKTKIIKNSNMEKVNVTDIHDFFDYIVAEYSSCSSCGSSGDK